jgi:hypothetical protein
MSASTPGAGSPFADCKRGDKLKLRDGTEVTFLVYDEGHELPVVFRNEHGWPSVRPADGKACSGGGYDLLPPKRTIKMRLAEWADGTVSAHPEYVWPGMEEAIERHQARWCSAVVEIEVTP